MAKKHRSDDRLYFKFLQYSLRLSHGSDNFTLCYPSHVSHFFYLPDFGRFSQSRDQRQPGSFLSPGSKREDPGNEVVSFKIGHFHDCVNDYNYQNPLVFCFLMLIRAIVI